MTSLSYYSTVVDNFPSVALRAMALSSAEHASLTKVPHLRSEELTAALSLPSSVYCFLHVPLPWPCLDPALSPF